MKTKNTQKFQISKISPNNSNTHSNLSDLVKTEIFDVGITNATAKEVLEYLVKILEKTQKKLVIMTPNPEMVMLAQASKDFRTTLNRADLALCDGIGLYKAAQLMGRPLKERIIGTNFVEMLIEKVNDWPITVGFLGGRAGVAEDTAECLVKKYPKLKVGFVGQEWNESGFENAKKFQKEENGRENKKIDILFIAYGAPKQETWMVENIDRLPVRIMMGVGGAFDQISDTTLRPPTWIHSVGLGWLYRLARQPWRIKRQLVLIPFIWMVLKEKFRTSFS